MQLLTPDLGLLLWTLLAFLIVFFILKKFAWKPILKTLNEREQGIADSIATAERVKSEMAALKNENEMLMQKAREALEQDRWPKFRDECLTRFVRSDKQI